MSLAVRCLRLLFRNVSLPCESMASSALQRSLGRCSLLLRHSYASLASPCSADGEWAGYHCPESNPTMGHRQAGAISGILPVSIAQLAAWQPQVSASFGLLSGLSSILPRTWLDGLADGLVLTSHQTYKPKVLKRKREHGFLKRCAISGSCCICWECRTALLCLFDRYLGRHSNPRALAIVDHHTWSHGIDSLHLSDDEPQ